MDRGTQMKPVHCQWKHKYCPKYVKWVMLWGCYACDSYTEIYLCIPHSVEFQAGNTLDACGKCFHHTGEYLVSEL